MSAGTVHIATAQYPVDFLGSFDRYRDKLTDMVGEAARNGARLLVFPEYAAMELASLFEPAVYGSLRGQLEAIQEYLPHFLRLHSELAKQHAIYILAGSFPVRVDAGQFRNRAYFFSPDGSADFQEKLHMTRFENEQWGISPGERIRVFETDFGRVGVNICYDSEFPLMARTQAEAGADLILTPSCTDTAAGYHRVRIGSQARALENQCHVVQSSLVGNADWSEAVDVNAGASAIYTPIDYGFPDDGVLVKGDWNSPGWVYGTVELQHAREIRNRGQVFNYHDWPRQFELELEAEIIKL